MDINTKSKPDIKNDLDQSVRYENKNKPDNLLKNHLDNNTGNDIGKSIQMSEFNINNNEIMEFNEYQLLLENMGLQFSSKEAQEKLKKNHEAYSQSNVSQYFLNWKYKDVDNDGQLDFDKKGLLDYDYNKDGKFALDDYKKLIDEMVKNMDVGATVDYKKAESFFKKWSGEE